MITKTPYNIEKISLPTSFFDIETLIQFATQSQILNISRNINKIKWINIDSGGNLLSYPTKFAPELEVSCNQTVTENSLIK